MPTIAKDEPGELTMQSASFRCVLGLSFNVLSQSQEIEHGCQFQPNQRSPQIRYVRTLIMLETSGGGRHLS